MPAPLTLRAVLYHSFELGGESDERAVGEPRPHRLLDGMCLRCRIIADDVR